MTPQQKKELSYQKDRRNVYGENDKASRKNLPRKKRLVNRSYRLKAKLPLQEIKGDVNLEVADRVVVPRRSTINPKVPDMRLGFFVEDRLSRRTKLSMNEAAAAAERIEAVRKKTARTPGKP